MQDFTERGAFLSMPLVSLCTTQHGFSPLVPHPAEFKPYHKNFYHESLFFYYFLLLFFHFSMSALVLFVVCS